MSAVDLHRARVVVGAGIGGMAAAVLLARAGARVTLLERAAEIRAVGAGILLQPNGPAVLRGLGANSALVDAAVLVAELSAAGSPEAGLAGYTARRRPAVHAVQTRADRLTRLAHLRAPLARRLRDAARGAAGRRPGAAERIVRAGQQEDPATLLALVSGIAEPRRTR